MSSSTAQGRSTSDDGRGSRRSIRWTVVGLVVAALIAVGAWLGYLAWQVNNDVSSVRAAVTQAQQALTDGDREQVEAHVATAISDSRSAADRTHDPVWSTFAALPWIGGPWKSTQQMADAVSALSTDVLEPSVELTEVLRPETLRDGDALRTAPLEQHAPRLKELAQRASEITNDVESVEPTWLPMVAQARTELSEQLSEVTGTLNGTHVAAELLPGMLGGHGPRHYFLALQTPSEARATGGLLGGFAIIDAKNGTVSAPTLGRNADLADPESPTLDLGEDYNTLYGWTKPYTDARNNNISPHFPDAARIWIANWQKQTGQRLDGAIAVDPVALSHVMEVTGPVTLPDGEEITADNVVPITLSTSYERFAGDNAARKTYLQTIARAVIEQTLSADAGTAALLEALGRGVHERRIMVYSTDQAEQALLEQTNLGHQIPDTEAPYLDVSVGNIAGNKIDYYLQRDLSYTAGECSPDGRTSTATITLTNTLTDLDLPDYVIGSLGAPGARLPDGTNFANLQLTMTAGSTLRSLTVDGNSPLYLDGRLHGHPVVTTQIRIPPGKSVTVEAVIDEPATAVGEPVVPVQPLVDDPAVTVDVPACAGTADESGAEEPGGREQSGQGSGG